MSPKWTVYRKNRKRPVVKLRACPLCMKHSPNNPKLWGHVPSTAEPSRLCKGCRNFTNLHTCK